jgi:hypothetical protein
MVFYNFRVVKADLKTRISTSVDLTATPPEPMFGSKGDVRIPRNRPKNFP